MAILIRQHCFEHLQLETSWLNFSQGPSSLDTAVYRQVKVFLQLFNAPLHLNINELPPLGTSWKLPIPHSDGFQATSSPSSNLGGCVPWVRPAGTSSQHRSEWISNRKRPSASQQQLFRCQASVLLFVGVLGSPVDADTANKLT